MELPITAALAAGLLAFAVFCGWRGARPPNPMRGPRMLPWRGLMLGSAAVLMVLIVKLADQLHLMG